MFRKCSILKSYDLESTINFFKKESISEWIVITPGSKGEELIKNLENFECIKFFFVFCWNIELHEKWASKINKVGIVTSDPEILCQKFIELNKKYLIPKFDFKCDINVDNILLNLLKMNSDNKFILNSVKREVKSFIEMRNKTKNKYLQFCIKSLIYLNENEIVNDFKETKIENTNLYLYSNMFRERDMSFFQNIINYFKNLTLISMHISQYPYLLNLLSFQEIIEILKVKITDNFFQDNYKDISATFDKIAKKINENENILDDTKELKYIQKFCIFSIYHDLGDKIGKDILFGFYQIINFLRDIDFCLKIQTYMEYGRFNNINHNFINEIYFSLYFSDRRFSLYENYIANIITPNELSKEEQNELNNTLTIKDFIIVEKKQFQEKIKIIENDFNAKSLAYLQIEQIWKYINEQNNIIKKKKKMRISFLIIIF